MPGIRAESWWDHPDARKKSFRRGTDADFGVVDKNLSAVASGLADDGIAE